LNTIPLLEPLAADLERVERRMREPMHPDYPQLTAVFQHLLDSGGKRLRPALALLVGRFYAERTDLDKLVSLAAAVEMLHTATLVHDDLIDGSLLRRGRTTLNARWNMGATVLTGDYLFARAASLAAETDDVRVMSIFANTLMTICSGELRQIFDRHTLPAVGGQESWQAALDRYDERIHAKTASLFAGATEAAAVLGGAPQAHVTALRDYGQALGMGFQIVDDVLDFRGDQEMLGKPVGSDLREGIVTLPVLYFLRAHPDDERVLTVIRDGGEDDLVRDIVVAVRESGAVGQAMDRARSFIAQSQAALDPLPEGEARSLMHALADYTISRQK
jgi:geranylgeranyl pyrophosphate synthase